jgi:hypothetical protein
MAGCGGDDEPKNAATTTPTETTTATSDTTTGATTTEQATTEAKKPARKKKRRGENQPGGAGDESEAFTPARFVGDGGTLTPLNVDVAPFINVRVFIRVKDKSGYFVIFKGGGELVTKEKRSVFTLPGLKPGEMYDGRYFVDGRAKGPVRIRATNEPGP